MIYSPSDCNAKPSLDDMGEEEALAFLRNQWSQHASGPVRSSFLTPQRMYSSIRSVPASLSEDPAPS